ncbi:5504_t:CDS:2 [Ambispora leptoticha]|uniref:5504_t:CDS:1 n=1 Tax=Ambispora leptoticha TaxID=144679 RepID=A0A9N9BPN6_9GLOM|nr:5504_t:CDS:2 [Ambispora leptoticha]
MWETSLSSKFGNYARRKSAGGKTHLRKVATPNFVKESQDLLLNIRRETNTTESTNSVYDDLVKVLKAVQKYKEEIESLKKNIDLRNVKTPNFVKESQDLLLNVRRETNTTGKTNSFYDDLVNVLKGNSKI